MFISWKNDTGSMTWQQLALFYGFLIFQKYNKIGDSAKFADWLRFVRNLITNGTIDTIDSFASAKKRLEMGKWSTDIYGKSYTDAYYNWIRRRADERRKPEGAYI